MTQAQKLEALVQRATDSGWKSPWEEYHYPLVYTESGVWPHSDSEYFTSIKDIIFNHDFARALFGERTCNCTPTQLSLSIVHEPHCRMQKPTWQERLQQAVISDDPIGYMYKASEWAEQQVERQDENN